MYKVRKRESLQKKVIALAGTATTPVTETIDLQTMLNALRSHPAAFADWRWNSLNDVVSDVLLVEDVLTFLFSEMNAKDMSVLVTTEDAPGLAQVIRSGKVFRQARAVRVMISELMTFMSWVGGCDCLCHVGGGSGAENCPLKGLRARSLARRVKTLLDAMHETRLSVDSASVGDAITRAIG